MTATTNPSNPPPPESILVVDDHPVFRKGVVDLLGSRWPTCRCVECGNGAQARVELARGGWALLVLDWVLPDAVGIDLLGGDWTPRTILFTMHRDAVLVEQARQMGAGGFVCKSESPERILDAAAAVLAGGRWFPDKCPETPALSERERCVLVALLDGEGPQAIARDLGLSRSSVQSYKERLFEKLKVDSLPELVRKASLLGLR